MGKLKSIAVAVTAAATIAVGALGCASEAQQRSDEIEQRADRVSSLADSYLEYQTCAETRASIGDTGYVMDMTPEEKERFLDLLMERYDCAGHDAELAARNATTTPAPTATLPPTPSVEPTSTMTAVERWLPTKRPPTSTPGPSPTPTLLPTQTAEENDQAVHRAQSDVVRRIDDTIRFNIRAPYGCMMAQEDAMHIATAEWKIGRHPDGALLTARVFSDDEARELVTAHLENRDCSWTDLPDDQLTKCIVIAQDFIHEMTADAIANGNDIATLMTPEMGSIAMLLRYFSTSTAMAGKCPEATWELPEAAHYDWTFQP